MLIFDLEPMNKYVDLIRMGGLLTKWTRHHVSMTSIVVISSDEESELFCSELNRKSGSVNWKLMEIYIVGFSIIFS